MIHARKLENVIEDLAKGPESAETVSVFNPVRMKTQKLIKLCLTH